MRDQVQWTSPSPFWSGASVLNDAALRRTALRRPTILRFASDSFMEDLIRVMDTDPMQLPSFAVKRETWRGPVADAETIKPAPAFAKTFQRLGLVARRKNQSALTVNQTTTVSTKPLKLYQPAHQRFYLVTACLVCGRVGLPDRTVNAGKQERVAFVIRRLMPSAQSQDETSVPPDSTWDEYAFVASDKGNAWKKIATTNSTATLNLIEDEEALPMFPVMYKEDDGRRRRFFAGMIPVARREAYMGATKVKEASDPSPLPDPRMMLVWNQFTEPWKRLLEIADRAKKVQADPFTVNGKTESVDAGLKIVALKATRELIQTSSWYALLDFAKFLEEHAPRIWNNLQGQTVQPPLDTDETVLVNTLKNTTLSWNSMQKINFVNNSKYQTSEIKNSLADALLAIHGGTDAQTIEDRLEAVTVTFDRNENNVKTTWLNFLFPLADSELPSLAPSLSGADNASKIDKLSDLIQAALPEQILGQTPQLPLAALPVMDTREGWFVVRCVFERPECGPIDPPVVSEKTEAFQMAGFFDPDAPARPIRIALPIDTTPAGLRKFDKNTAFMMSDILCGQVKKAQSLSLGDLVMSVLPWPFHKDLSVEGGTCKDSEGFDVGMICSFSIPIITICALLLLIIIVSLLDIIFRWMPYFFICFPFPKKAKQS
jgi:hypothetical protein